MRVLTFTVPESFDGSKLKTFLRGGCQVSSGILTRLKWVYDGITVNGVHTYVTQLVHTGDVVRLALPSSQLEAEPVALPLDIVYEDEDLLLINKPCQMPIYPTAGHARDSLANAVASYIRQRKADFAFHPIYRLDKDTSGIIVLAKHCYSASRLAFGVTKTYTAICEGLLSGSGTIDAPLRLMEGHTIQREVGAGPGSQRAVTHWKAIDQQVGHTLLEIHLETGRTHQIRVHFSSIGHPLAGDDLYGGSREKIGRQALHCGNVSFIHPVTGAAMTFHRSMPQDMQNLCQEGS